LKLKEIEMARNDRFDISKHVRFVPPFQDKEVDKYFLLFEKVAKDLNWPLDKYTILLQCVLKGKACDIYLIPCHFYFFQFQLQLSIMLHFLSF
jgi:hypothetical protein